MASVPPWEDSATTVEGSGAINHDPLDKGKGKEVRTGILEVPFGSTIQATNIRTEYIADQVFTDVFLLATYADPTKAVRFGITAGTVGGQSPVFSAMFRHKFAERTQISSILRTGEPGEIPLPEDDPDALRTLLRLMHNRKSGGGAFQNPELTMFQIENLAILCDKHQVLDTLKPWVSLWPTSTDLKDGLYRPTLKRMCLAYAFDDHKEFAAASLSVLWDYSESDLKIIMAEEERMKTLLAILPEGFLNK